MPQEPTSSSARGSLRRPRGPRRALQDLLLGYTPPDWQGKFDPPLDPGAWNAYDRLYLAGRISESVNERMLAWAHESATTPRQAKAKLSAVRQLVVCQTLRSRPTDSAEVGLEDLGTFLATYTHLGTRRDVRKRILDWLEWNGVPRPSIEEVASITDPKVQHALAEFDPRRPYAFATLVDTGAISAGTADLLAQWSETPFSEKHSRLTAARQFLVWSSVTGQTTEIPGVSDNQVERFLDRYEHPITRQIMRRGVYDFFAFVGDAKGVEVPHWEDPRKAHSTVRVLSRLPEPLQEQIRAIDERLRKLVDEDEVSWQFAGQAVRAVVYYAQDSLDELSASPTLAELFRDVCHTVEWIRKYPQRRRQQSRPAAWSTHVAIYVALRRVLKEAAALGLLPHAIRRELQAQIRKDDRFDPGGEARPQRHAPSSVKLDAILTDLRLRALAEARRCNFRWEDPQAIPSIGQIRLYRAVGLLVLMLTSMMRRITVATIDLAQLDADDGEGVLFALGVREKRRRTKQGRTSGVTEWPLFERILTTYVEPYKELMRRRYGEHAFAPIDLPPGTRWGNTRLKASLTVTPLWRDARNPGRPLLMDAIGHELTWVLEPFGLTGHDLRRAGAANPLLEGLLSILEAAKLGGWDDLKTMAQRYLTPDRREVARTVARRLYPTHARIVASSERERLEQFTREVQEVLFDARKRFLENHSVAHIPASVIGRVLDQVSAALARAGAPVETRHGKFLSEEQLVVVADAIVKGRGNLDGASPAAVLGSVLGEELKLDFVNAFASTRRTSRRPWRRPGGAEEVVA